MGAPSFISSIDLRRSVPSMAFPRSLSTSEMAEYVAYHFEWDRCGVAFPPFPLPNDFQALCPSYDLAVVEDAAQRFKLPKLPQVIFYAMLLNEAERLGVLHGRTLRRMESALIELRWSTFEAWMWQNGDWIFEARFREKAEYEEESLDTEGAASPSGDDKQGEAGREEADSFQMRTSRSEADGWPRVTSGLATEFRGEIADFIRESFTWHWRSATRSPPPLSDDYEDLCPRFTRSDAKRAALDFELPEMVQATFYAMLLNDVIELGIVSGFLTIDLKLTLEGLRLTSFEAWLSRTSRDLREAQFWKRTLPSGASGSMNGHEGSAGSTAPRPFPTIFYTMVVNDAVELGLTCRLTAECMVWVMQKLDWALIEF
ncbi:hypothetical protein Cgig2_022894 [Carnegiea gigantea]|uniref:Uncharacterized protein n=1 Tax=Carnegiea gigantea TaxID=171969 RepID=A0A9Q1QP29_9CARY|nr:hypothetical protein Cgig2_022894 [Carnegiea gigantea]